MSGWLYKIIYSSCLVLSCHVTSSGRSVSSQDRIIMHQINITNIKTKTLVGRKGCQFFFAKSEQTLSQYINVLKEKYTFASEKNRKSLFLR